MPVNTKFVKCLDFDALETHDVVIVWLEDGQQLAGRKINLPNEDGSFKAYLQLGAVDEQTNSIEWDGVKAFGRSPDVGWHNPIISIDRLEVGHGFAIGMRDSGLHARYETAIIAFSVLSSS